MGESASDTIKKIKTNASTVTLHPHVCVPDQTNCRTVVCGPTITTPVLLISVACDIGQLLSADRHADGLIEAAKGLLSDEQSPKRRKILTDLLQNLEDRSELEGREEDENWFEGTKSSGDSGHPHMSCLVYQLVRQHIAATITEKICLVSPYNKIFLF